MQNYVTKPPQVVIEPKRAMQDRGSYGKVRHQVSSPLTSYRRITSGPVASPPTASPPPPIVRPLATPVTACRQGAVLLNSTTWAPRSNSFGAIPAGDPGAVLLNSTTLAPRSNSFGAIPVADALSPPTSRHASPAAPSRPGAVGGAEEEKKSQLGIIKNPLPSPLTAGRLTSGPMRQLASPLTGRASPLTARGSTSPLTARGSRSGAVGGTEEEGTSQLLEPKHAMQDESSAGLMEHQLSSQSPARAQRAISPSKTAGTFRSSSPRIVMHQLSSLLAAGGQGPVLNKSTWAPRSPSRGATSAADVFSPSTSRHVSPQARSRSPAVAGKVEQTTMPHLETKHAIWDQASLGIIMDQLSPSLTAGVQRAVTPLKSARGPRSTSDGMTVASDALSPPASPPTPSREARRRSRAVVGKEERANDKVVKSVRLKHSQSAVELRARGLATAIEREVDRGVDKVNICVQVVDRPFIPTTEAPGSQVIETDTVEIRGQALEVDEANARGRVAECDLQSTVVPVSQDIETDKDVERDTITPLAPVCELPEIDQANIRALVTRPPFTSSLMEDQRRQEQSITRLQKQMENLQKDVDDYQKQMENLQKDVDELQTKGVKDQPWVDGRDELATWREEMAAIQQSLLEDAKSSIESVRADLSAFEEKMLTYQQSQEALLQKCQQDTVEAKFRSYSNLKLQRLEGLIDEVKEEYKDSFAHIKAIEIRIQNLEPGPGFLQHKDLLAGAEILKEEKSEHAFLLKLMSYMKDQESGIHRLYSAQSNMDRAIQELNKRCSAIQTEQAEFVVSLNDLKLKVKFDEFMGSQPITSGTIVLEKCPPHDREMGLSVDAKGKITAIANGGPADRKNLKAGNAIIKVNGEDWNHQSYKCRLEQLESEDTLTLEIR